MAWNESGNGKNPWERGNKDGPPDLDKILRDWQQRLNGLFGGRGGGGRGTEGRGGSSSALVGLLVLIALGWLATGFYRVNEAERGVVLRFGAYEATRLPGLRWHLPWPIESVEKVNIAQITPFSQQTKMLTSDENIVTVDLVVQYQRADPVKYLFNVRDPESTLGDASESAIREVVGKSKIDFVLTEGRAEIAARTQELIQQALDEYGTGIIVTKVNLQDTNFPREVDVAVQDAIKAREDKERLSFEAQTYANDIVPKARGEAARRIQDAEAYKSRVIADAQGETSRFEQLLVEYEKAPLVTRERLYIEALEEVYGNSSKILLDAKGSGNLVYLPVDKMLEERADALRSQGSAKRSMSGSDSDQTQGTLRSQRDDLRSRGSR